ncbi:hypothetical protein E1265_23795 [Streptomyces sp. 8K308]|nr:hypothetical protein E1265_23795 [Streptomyces sp. 8K308]
MLTSFRLRLLPAEPGRRAAPVGGRRLAPVRWCGGACGAKPRPAPWGAPALPWCDGACRRRAASGAPGGAGSGRAGSCGGACGAWPRAGAWRRRPAAGLCGGAYGAKPRLAPGRRTVARWCLRCWATNGAVGAGGACRR